MDRFKEESLMMVMEVPDLDETCYTFESIHLHPKSAVWNQLAQNCGIRAKKSQRDLNPPSLRLVIFLQ